ncbi:PilW family protein [Bacillus sp. UMB0728]|uniref:PilW family protein n=1 Tax=Bacillus sp. UMB0728 TaxID=2066052 RepID=UPI000C756697|nr:type II secretion system protein [Bacillus sp. UMB0728]PLR72800.1 hypothetical protein CYJ37_14860 [Bacillus sp. UMB0728]
MKIFDNKGFTLYELLAVLAITAIVLPVIYGVFTSGIKLYNKIQVEGQLRDDADYTSTMIMNAFYSYPFDYVKSCGDDCIELVNSTFTGVDKVENNSSEATFYGVYRNKKNTSETSVRIELTEKATEDGTVRVFEIDGKPLEVESDFKDSKLVYNCASKAAEAACGKGMISLDYSLDNHRLEEALDLHSKFGFSAGGPPDEE